MIKKWIYIIILGIGIMFVLLLWKYPPNNAKNATFWTMLCALFALCGLFGIYLIWKQLRIAAWANAQDIVTDPNFIAARTFVERCFQERDWQPTYTGIERAKIVCRMWDKLACLVEQRFLSKRKALEYWGVPMGKCWTVVEERWHVISDERTICKGHSDKWHAFNDLGRKSATIIRKEKPELNA
jgi:ABC-type nickel/cobalt efflux system permease component RcnA